MQFHQIFNSFMWVIALLPLMLQLDGVKSFAPSSTISMAQRRRPSSSSSSTSTTLNCICINCKYVTSCMAYHFVEEKHEQPHMTENPTFEPQNGSPTIHVNVRTIRAPKDADDANMSEYERMWKEHEDETRKAEANSSSPDANAPLHGSETYDLSPVTTYEYDVVACADYAEDMGCWVRNMPQAIKEANPDFVPS